MAIARRCLGVDGTALGCYLGEGEEGKAPLVYITCWQVGVVFSRRRRPPGRLTLRPHDRPIFHPGNRAAFFPSATWFHPPRWGSSILPPRQRKRGVLDQIMVSYTVPDRLSRGGRSNSIGKLRQNPPNDLFPSCFHTSKLAYLILQADACAWYSSPPGSWLFTPCFSPPVEKVQVGVGDPPLGPTCVRRGGK